MPSQTPSQTAGPYLHIGMLRDEAPLKGELDGKEILLHGLVFDGEGATVRDCILESWNSRHFARAQADFETGRFVLHTTMPPVDFPYLHLQIFARGLNHGLQTRVYLETIDPVVTKAIGNRTKTLLARGEGDGEYRFDIHLQGHRETVFLAL